MIVFMQWGMTGCASSNQPNLAWMYAPDNATQQPPLVIIPGLMGSRLVDHVTGEERWPGDAINLMFRRYPELSMPLVGEESRAELVAGGLTDRVAGRDFYRSILNTLETAAGYRRANTADPQPPGSRTYYVFTYDWRHDLQQTAAELHQFIESIRRQAGDPALKVDVLAHSMGGLIVRYYIRYGDADVLNDNELQPTMAGAASIRRTILLGTPNLGSVEAIQSMIEGRRLGLRSIAPETLASMPSMFQLFPHALADWIVTAAGTPLQRDQFDVNVWRRFQWSVFDPSVRRRLAKLHGVDWSAAYQRQVEEAFAARLERGRRFVWSLTVPTPRSVPLIVFGGDCRYTPARIVVEEIDGESNVRLWPNEVSAPHDDVDYRRLMLEPGDGAVTKSSLLARMSIDPTVGRHRYTHFPLDYAFLLCEEHAHLAGNPSFQDNLLDALLRKDST